MSKSDPPRHRHDKKLWSLLPPKEDPYDETKLSEFETNALVESLDDGFGKVGEDRDLRPLPDTVKSGLMDHRFYVEKDFYEPEDFDDVFWNGAYGDDAPPPAEQFPLTFVTRRLRIYFENQFDRFSEVCERERRLHWEDRWKAWELPPYDVYKAAQSSDEQRKMCEGIANLEIYKKPWYELHALQFLDRIDEDFQRKRTFFAIIWAGQLGRLVEQYYWRFRFEGAAITGAGARKGASAGGKAKAALHRPQHDAWQNAAAKIWAERPGMKKSAVARQISRNLGKPTEKHIARYIRPSAARK